MFLFLMWYLWSVTICLQHCLVKILGFNYSTWIIVCGKPLTFTNKFILEIILYNYTRFLYIILTLFFIVVYYSIILNVSSYFIWIFYTKTRFPISVLPSRHFYFAEYNRALVFIIIFHCVPKMNVPSSSCFEWSYRQGWIQR